MIATDERLIEKSEIVEFWESNIDNSEKVYLITWSPDPSKLPDADFRLQHEFNVQMLADYLRCCKSGLFCVESTQLGNPHYHGWYQVSDESELPRITLMKVLERFGIVKLVECRTWKVNCYSEKANGLYYYKKDIYTAMIDIDINPIHKDSVSNVDWQSMAVQTFFTKEVKNPKLIENVQSDRQFYRQFYHQSV